jgi:hypothetical protein
MWTKRSGSGSDGDADGKKDPTKMSYMDYMQQRDKQDLVESSVLSVLWNAINSGATLHNGNNTNDLHSFCKALDKDSSGRISAEELRYAVASLNIMLSVDQLKHLLDLIDTTTHGGEQHKPGERERENKEEGEREVIDFAAFEAFMLKKAHRDELDGQQATRGAAATNSSGG